MKSKTPKLIPPDRKQCQAEKPNGLTFMTLGGRPGLVRCENKPTLIVTEGKAGSDGLKGSMSFCPDCFVVFQKQIPQKAKVAKIKPL